MDSSDVVPEPRLRHCVELVTPATDWHKLEKAVASGADRICIDLEDAVPPGEKGTARRRACDALTELDWSGLRASVRVNGVGTPYFDDDLEALVGSPTPGLSAVLIPKVGSVAEVRHVESRIEEIERRTGRRGRLEIDLLLESPAGIVDAAVIARSSRRIATIALGPGDLTMALGSRTFGPNRADPSRISRLLDHPRSAVLFAARTAGVRVLDGPALAAIDDLDAYEADARLVSFMGFDGKWAIHPAQIARAQAAFAPTPEELAWARETWSLWEQATAQGVGALRDSGGRLIDAAPAEKARRLLAAAGV